MKDTFSIGRTRDEIYFEETYFNRRIPRRSVATLHLKKLTKKARLNWGITLVSVGNDLIQDATRK